MKNNSLIILGSTSPRRIELMAHAGIKVIVQAPHADETPLPREKPLALVKRLALAKAQSLAEGGKHRDVIIISADTIVVDPKGKKILGKPTSPADAKKMLRSLSGQTHTVLTGYTILAMGPKQKPVTLSRVVRSQVTLVRLSDRLIDAYVKSGEPMDKAGSYAAQGRGMVFVASIRGSYSNVVGLPMAELLADLHKSFGILPFGV